MKIRHFAAGLVLGVVLTLAAGGMVAQQGADFDPVDTRTPTAIGPIEITLYDHDGTTAGMSARGTARVLDADGDVIAVKGPVDVEPLLTNAQRRNLVGILDKIRSEAGCWILSVGC